jgi:putative hydrolase of the HAD superfamily
MLKAIIFDLGDTLIYERVDDVCKLDQMTLHLRPHVHDMLETLSQRFKIGLITDTETSHEDSVRVALRNLTIEAFFSVVVTSIDIGARKPDSEIFFEVLHQLNVSPDEAIMVGNDAERDIIGAKKVGIVSVLYRSSKYYNEKDENRADYYIDSFDEIQDIISAITQREGKGH